MNRLKKMISCFALLLVAMTLLISADSVYNTENDPLITLSYAKTTLKKEIVDEVLKVVNEQPQLPAASSGYTVVYLEKGQKLMAKTSCELITTCGEVSVIITDPNNVSNGVGLNDVTAANRVLNGEGFPCNHYIIIPRADGRGFEVTSEYVYVMIRGEYTVA